MVGAYWKKMVQKLVIFNRDIDESGENFTFSEVTHKNEAEKINGKYFRCVWKNISPAMKKRVF